MSDRRHNIELDRYNDYLDFEKTEGMLRDKVILPGDKDRRGDGLFGILLDHHCLSSEAIDMAVKYGFDINRDGTSETVGGLLNGIAKVDAQEYGNVDNTFGSSNIDIAKKLISLGVDLEKRDFLGGTALHNSTNPELTKLLVDSGADVNAQDNDNLTPFFFNNSANRRVLLKAGADVNVTDEEGSNALFSHHNTISDLKFLIDECGVDPTHENHLGLMAHESLENIIEYVDYEDAPRIEESVEFLKNAVNQKQKERMLEAVNEEQTIENKPTQRRRRM